jgi:hypothetical protein
LRQPATESGASLKYVIEFETNYKVIWKTLDRIHKRDGMKIFKEVAGRLLDSVTISVENRADGRHVRRGDRPAVAA